MNNFIALLIGELQRLKKYNILASSFLVSLIWIGVLHFTGIKDVSAIFPLLIFFDSTAMSLLLIGVTMFFEKQEGSIKSLRVSPISKSEYILAKTTANILSNIETLLILYVYALLFKEIHVNIISLIFSVILIAFLHSLIGFYLTYYSKDFTELLIGMMKYTLVFTVPIVFEQVGLIKNETLKKLLYIIPTKSSMTLLESSVMSLPSWEIYLSIVYLILSSILLYWVVLHKFDQFAVKESGV